MPSMHIKCSLRGQCTPINISRITDFCAMIIRIKLITSYAHGIQCSFVQVCGYYQLWCACCLLARIEKQLIKENEATSLIQYLPLTIVVLFYHTRFYDISTQLIMS